MITEGNSNSQIKLMPLSFKQARFPNYFAGTLDLLQNKKLFNPALELGKPLKIWIVRLLPLKYYKK